jgi:tryptophanyl-tRNA synthetase
LPGLDGRKMSKSYDNTIPLFAGGKKALRDTIMRIVTDSRAPGEPKDAEGSALFTLFRAFASEHESAVYRQALEEGLGWGEAKQILYERIETDVAPMRERYEALMADPAGIEAILLRGAAKARAIATPKLAALRETLGLRSAAAPGAAGAAKKVAVAGKAPRFASFRDADGKFRFRLFSAEGEQLLLSIAFDDPKAAGAMQKRIGSLGATGAVLRMKERSMTLDVDGEAVAETPDYADASARDDALPRLREALGQLAIKA